jgi:hypothetical protein
MFQIEAAASDPITRTAALLSLVCAVMSLSYGVLFIIRFGTMRSMYKASRWAEAAQRSRTSIWWNVWVLLAMPAVWLAWSMIFFLATIMSFVWRTGAATDAMRTHDDGMPEREALAARVVITTLFGLGMVYLVAIIATFRSYGNSDVYAPGSNPMTPPASPPASPPMGGAQALGMVPLVPIPLSTSGPTPVTATPRCSGAGTAPHQATPLRREPSERGRRSHSQSRSRARSRTRAHVREQTHIRAHAHAHSTDRGEPTELHVGLGLVGVGPSSSAANLDLEKGELIPGLAALPSLEQQPSTS